MESHSQQFTKQCFDFNNLGFSLILNGWLCFSFQRILTGFKQRNMFLNKHQIIHSWLDFIHVSKQLAGTQKENHAHPESVLCLSFWVCRLLTSFNELYWAFELLILFQVVFRNWICEWWRSYVPHAKTAKITWRPCKVRNK